MRTSQTAPQVTSLDQIMIVPRAISVRKRPAAPQKFLKWLPFIPTIWFGVRIIPLVRASQTATGWRTVDEMMAHEMCVCVCAKDRARVRV